MRTHAKITSILAALLMLFGAIGFAGKTGHYVNGIEGIKAGTIPPPGNYYRVYHAGYAQWQVTDDEYTTLMLSTGLYDETIHDECYAVGPEVGAFIPKSKFFLNVRGVWEFGSKDRSRGNKTTRTLTKIL